MQVARTETFRRSWSRLVEDDKAAARKIIMNLAVGIRPQGLKVTRMNGSTEIWEARVSPEVRMTFQANDKLLILRNIGRY